jgi:ribonuclease G
MPEAGNIGISRKIVENAERDRLRKIGDKLRVPGFGIIIRTEAEDKSEADLIADRDFLLDLWKQVQETNKKVRAPALVHQDLTLVYKTLRDLFGSDVSRMLIDSPVEYQNAAELIEAVSPRLRGRVQLYTSEVPLFKQFGVEQEIERSLKRKVWLRSGGYLIMDETEALTVIDVNTGKFTGGANLSETIVKTNIDAANEIARQLRLRDIGGIIVIDFIDMNIARDRQSVIRALEQSLKRDRSRTKISTISPLGLVEMTRKRTAETIGSFLTDTCPHCGGRGYLPSAETLSITVEREIVREVREAKKPQEAVLVTCHPSVAELLIGEDGDNVDRIEREIERAVLIRGDIAMHPESFEVQHGSLTDFEKKYRPYKRAQVVECKVAPSTVLPDTEVVGWADGYRLDLENSKKFVGMRVKAKIVEPRRSFASAVLIPGTHRAVDNSTGL